MLMVRWVPHWRHLVPIREALRVTWMATHGRRVPVRHHGIGWRRWHRTHGASIGVAWARARTAKVSAIRPCCERIWLLGIETILAVGVVVPGTD